MSVLDELNDSISLSNGVLIDFRDLFKVIHTLFRLNIGLLRKLFGDINMPLNQEKLKYMFLEFIRVMMLKKMHPFLLFGFGFLFGLF